MSDEKISLDEARTELAAGRAVHWDTVDPSDLDDARPEEVQKAMDDLGVDTEAGLQSLGRNFELDVDTGAASTEAQEAGVYEDAEEALEDIDPVDPEASDEEKQEHAEEVAEALAGAGTTEAELQNASALGVTEAEPANPRNEAQQNTLVQSVEQAGGETTDQNLRAIGGEHHEGTPEEAKAEAANEDANGVEPTEEAGGGEGEPAAAGPASAQEEELGSLDPEQGGAPAPVAEGDEDADGTSDEDEASEEPKTGNYDGSVADFEAAASDLDDAELERLAAEDTRKGVKDAAQHELESRA